MKGFCAALGLQQHHVGAHQAVLHAVIVLERAHFLDGIRIGSHCGLPHVAAIHVPDSVERVQGSAIAHAVDRHDVARGAAALVQGRPCRQVNNPRNQRREALVVAAVEWKRNNLFPGDLIGDLARTNLHLNR